MQFSDIFLSRFSGDELGSGDSNVDNVLDDIANLFTIDGQYVVRFQMSRLSI